MIGMDMKRRVCVVLAIKLGSAQKAGARTLTPELVLQWLNTVGEAITPEATLSGPERTAFHSVCTSGELTWLLEQYEKRSEIELKVSAEHSLGSRMDSGDVSLGS